MNFHFVIAGLDAAIHADVSHFAFLQNPEEFNADVLHFLERVKRR